MKAALTWRKGSDSTVKSQEEGKHSDKEEGRPHFEGQYQINFRDKGKTFKKKASPAKGGLISVVGSPPVGGSPGVSTRWRALAVDACLVEGEHASSPVEKAVVGSSLGPFGCPEPFLFTAPSSCQSVAQKRLGRKIIVVWSGENLALVRRWEEFWKC